MLVLAFYLFLLFTTEFSLSLSPTFWQGAPGSQSLQIYLIGLAFTSDVNSSPQYCARLLSTEPCLQGTSPPHTHTLFFFISFSSQSPKVETVPNFFRKTEWQQDVKGNGRAAVSTRSTWLQADSHRPYDALPANICSTVTYVQLSAAPCHQFTESPCQHCNADGADGALERSQEHEHD